MQHFLKIAKALSDENRLRILGALKEGELCVCQVTDLLSLAPSTISKHLSILKNAALIDSRKQGRWIYYRMVDSPGPGVATEALDWVFRTLESTSQFAEDRRRLLRIREMEPEVFCESGSSAGGGRMKHKANRIQKKQGKTP